MSLSRRIFTVGAATALAQIVTAASTPLLTRLFAPEAHASWAIFLSASVIFSGIATLRYELAVVLPRDRQQSAGLVLAGCTVAVVVSVLAGVGLGWAGPHWLPSQWHRALRLWCWLVPISVLSTAIYQLAIAWCTREATFRLYSAAQFALPVAILLGQLSFAVAGRRDAWGLIGGTVCGQLAVATVLGAWLWWRDRPVIQAASWRSVLEAAKAFRNYPLYMTPYTVVGLARERLAYFLLGRLGTPAAAGHYSLVARLINLPNSLVASAVRPVFFQHAVGRDHRALEEPVHETMWSIGMIGVLVWAPCVPHAAWLCVLIFGPAWEAAAPYAVPLSICSIPLAMGNWADRLFDILGRQRLALVMELSFSGLAMAGLALGYLAFHELLWAIWVQSLLLTLYYITWMLVLFRIAGFSATRLARSIGGIAIAGVAAWLVCEGVARQLPPPAAFGLTAGTAGLIAAWLAHRQWLRIRSAAAATVRPS